MSFLRRSKGTSFTMMPQKPKEAVSRKQAEDLEAYRQKAAAQQSRIKENAQMFRKRAKEFVPTATEFEEMTEAERWHETNVSIVACHLDSNRRSSLLVSTSFKKAKVSAATDQLRHSVDISKHLTSESGHWYLEKEGSVPLMKRLGEFPHESSTLDALKKDMVVIASNSKYPGLQTLAKTDPTALRKLTVISAKNFRGKWRDLLQSFVLGDSKKDQLSLKTVCKLTASDLGIRLASDIDIPDYDVVQDMFMDQLLVTLNAEQRIMDFACVYDVADVQHILEQFAKILESYVTYKVTDLNCSWLKECVRPTDFTMHLYQTIMQTKELSFYPLSQVQTKGSSVEDSTFTVTASTISDSADERSGILKRMSSTESTSDCSIRGSFAQDALIDLEADINGDDQKSVEKVSSAQISKLGYDEAHHLVKQMNLWSDASDEEIEFKLRQHPQVHKTLAEQDPEDKSWKDFFVGKVILCANKVKISTSTKRKRDPRALKRKNKRQRLIRDA